MTRMSWLDERESEFTRDLLRDFCQICQALRNVSRILEEKINLFAAEGVWKSSKDKEYESREYKELRELIGFPMSKGILWSLKDTAHLLFGDKSQHKGKKNALKKETPFTGQLLDWCFGYMFHECIKLMEDIYQCNKYVAHFLSPITPKTPELGICLRENIKPVLCNSIDSIKKSIDSLRIIMDQCLELFGHFLPLQQENLYLARYIFENKELIRDVFGERFDVLLVSLYGENEEHLPLFAARSLRISGFFEQARQALDAAIRINAYHPMVSKEKVILDNQMKIFKP